MKADKYTRAQVLGMPLDTAERKLRRIIMWEFLRQLGQDVCEVCGGGIEAPEDLAMRHRRDWLEDASLYWDPQNILFTHTGCQPHKDTMNLEHIRITIATSSGDISPISWQGAQYLPVRHGDTFKITLSNPSIHRVLAVITVDGRNIITGDSGSAHGSGYVLRPFKSTTITGWREDKDHTAVFKFCRVGDAYATQVSGSSQNVGVIGVALFREEEEYRPTHLRESRRIVTTYGRSKGIGTLDSTLGIGTLGVSNSTLGTGDDILRSSVPTASAASATASEEDWGLRHRSFNVQTVGTGYGERISSPSTETTFRRATMSPERVVVFHYDTIEALRSRGVPVEDPGGPQAFPEDKRYAPPPPRRV